MTVTSIFPTVQPPSYSGGASSSAPAPSPADTTDTTDQSNAAPASVYSAIAAANDSTIRGSNLNILA